MNDLHGRRKGAVIAGIAMAGGMWLVLRFGDPPPKPRATPFPDVALRARARTELRCPDAELTVIARDEERTVREVCARGCNSQARYAWSTPTSSWERSSAACPADAL